MQAERKDGQQTSLAVGKVTRSWWYLGRTGQQGTSDVHVQVWCNWSPRPVHADSSMPSTGELSVRGAHSEPLAKQNVKDLFSQMNDKPWFPLKKQFKGPSSVTSPILFPAGTEASPRSPLRNWLSLDPGSRGSRSAVTILLCSLPTHVTLWNSFMKLHLTCL